MKPTAGPTRRQFIANGDAYDEFVVKPSSRSIEKEIESLLASDEATRADMAVALRKLGQEIAERRRAEEILREDEEKYRTILENIEEGYYEVDLAGNFTFFNDSVCRMLGYPKDELMGMNHRTYTDQAHSDRLYQVSNRVYTTGEPAKGVDWKIIRKDGAIRFIEASVSLIKDSNGRPTGFRGIARDITDRKEAEEALRESEGRFKTLFEESAEAQLLLDGTGKVVDCNRAFLALFALQNKTEVMGHTPGDFAPEFQPDGTPSRERGREVSKTVLEQGSTRYEWGHLKHDASRTPVLTELMCTLLSIFGQPMIHVAIRDITARKKAEEALRESEEKYRLVIENAQEAIFVIQDKMFRFINQETERITGYSGDELTSKPFVDLVHPDDQTMVAGNHEKRLRGQPVPPVYPFRIVDKDGKTKWVEANGIVFNWNGKPGTLNFVRDITERKRVEAALQESEEKYRTLVANANDAIFIVQDGLLKFPNPITLKLIGYSQEEIAALPFMNLIHPEDQAMVVDNYARRLGGEDVPSTYAFRVMNKRGEELWGQLNAILITWEGRPAVLCFIRDITSQKRLEGQYLHAQKMEAIGTLAGGIAHDFNNILSAILGYAELAKFDLEEGSKAQYDLEQSIRAAHRAKDLVRQILSFSRQGSQERKLLSIKPVVKEGLKFLRASLPTTIEIRQEMEEDLGMIESDPTQVHQVLMNLCTNAAHAMEEKGGVLEVSLGNSDIDKVSVAHGVVEPGSYVRLRVSDTGMGMPPEILKRIFDPYFTTKEAGKGTGLGLSVVHGIVKSYGGGITVSSQVGKGSTFDVYFPRVESAGLSWETDEVETLPTGSHERVLLVDDEEAIVEVGRNLLEYLGYQVVTQTSSLKALELFRAQAERFDLVITDMTMPNLTGDKLAQELLRIRPGIPIILCTGFSEHITEAKARAMGVLELAMKPLAMKELAKAIRRALDSKKKGKGEA